MFSFVRSWKLGSQTPLSWEDTPLSCVAFLSIDPRKVSNLLLQFPSNSDTVVLWYDSDTFIQVMYMSEYKLWKFTPWHVVEMLLNQHPQLKWTVVILIKGLKVVRDGLIRSRCIIFCFANLAIILSEWPSSSHMIVSDLAKQASVPIRLQSFTRYYLYLEQLNSW